MSVLFIDVCGYLSLFVVRYVLLMFGDIVLLLFGVRCLLLLCVVLYVVCWISLLLWHVGGVVN